MWQCSNCWVSMVYADGLVPIWRQGICSHHDDIGQSVHSGVSRHNELIIQICRCYFVKNIMIRSVQNLAHVRTVRGTIFSMRFSTIQSIRLYISYNEFFHIWHKWFIFLKFEFKISFWSQVAHNGNFIDFRNILLPAMEWHVLGQFCGCWWVGALAPGHQQPQCWPSPHHVSRSFQMFNSLWPCDAIWRYRTWVNFGSGIINRVQWHSSIHPYPFQIKVLSLPYSMGCMALTSGIFQEVLIISTSKLVKWLTNIHFSNYFYISPRQWVKVYHAAEHSRSCYNKTKVP